jgi:glycosyltransferase involved in cell wall biosynthesis
MDAIFVPCTWNKEVFEKSGVTVPLYIVQPGVILENAPAPVKSQEDKFNFYSIFQWTERKNPDGLIKAFYSEFSKDEKVRLILKSYRSARLPDSRPFINHEIARIQRELNLKEYPEIDVKAEFFSSKEMYNLHSRGNCFVLPTRSEGWGLPAFDAMLHGNPAIVTNYSGVTDFMESGFCRMLNYQMTPVSGMEWYVPWFNGKMSWAEADLRQLKKEMRSVYENESVALEAAVKGRKHLLDNFNTRNSAQMFLEAAKDIMEK